MAESNYKVAGSLNFKRMKKGGNISTTIETKSSAANRLLDQVRKCRGIEGFINHRLYHIHASSQNYYFVKDVNQIVADERTPAAIKFKDLGQDQQSEELMKRFYKIKEYQPKLAKLCEYYKFHKEIPRMFAKESYDTFFDHHDKKRKVEYVVITKKLRADTGEDIKAELEQNLKKVREAKYEPLLQDLYINTHLKTAKMGKPSGRQRSQPNESLGSLQGQLSKMFRLTDASMSELNMLSLSRDESASFAGRLPPELGLAAGLAPLSLAKATGPVRVVAGPGKPAVISPGVIESLKKIALPGAASKPGSLGHSKLRSSFSREVDIVDAKTASKRPAPKALTREPSLKTGPPRNKSSGSVKRGLTLTKRNPDDEVKVVSLKRENSDFRITKKNSLDFEGSQKKIGEVYSSTERKTASKTTIQPQTSLINLNLSEKNQASIASTGNKYKSTLKAFPSAPKLQINEFSQPSVRSKELVKNSSTKNLHLKSKANSPNPGPNLSSVNNLQNFKVDIDRLLRASGIMEYGTKMEPTPLTITNRGTGNINSNFHQQASKHKYTRSGPEVLGNTTSRGIGQGSTFRSNQGSIDGNANNLLRQTNSIGGAKIAGPTMKSTSINFYGGDPLPSERSQAFRINQPQVATTVRESAFHKKGSFSMTQNKPYLVESQLMEQRGVKLVKKATTRNAAKKL